MCVVSSFLITVQATRAAVEMQYLIQQPRRSSFDVRFKRLLVVVLAGLGLLLLTNVLFALFVFWLDFASPLPVLALIVQLIHLLVVLLLDGAVG